MPKTMDDWTNNFQELPLHVILCEWLMKNMHIPTDFGTLVAYIGLFLLSWYAIIWIVRLLISIIWPLFIISAAIVVMRILQYYEPEEITAIFMKSFTIIADALVSALAKGIEIVLGFFE